MAVHTAAPGGVGKPSAVSLGEKKPRASEGLGGGATARSGWGQEKARRRVNITTTGVLNKGTLPGESHDPIVLGAHSVGNGLSGLRCAA